ncbi:MAG: chemotaxis response regulator protein-glutamate methylesterase [Rhodocyclaceae bacterium]
MKIKVLVVDDSALMRAVLSEIINSAPDLQVVGASASASQAREDIKALNPDVMTLDVEMPGMDGLDFLDKVMRLRPMPVVMISSLTARGSEVTLKALELGAVDFISKPKGMTATGIQASADEICEKIRGAWQARRSIATTYGSANVSARQQSAATSQPASPAAALSARALSDRFIMIGASTGGTEAIKEVLSPLPAEMPPILIVQHMPEMFTASFAKRLDSVSKLAVKEAEDGERIRPGVAYLAPGHSHLYLRKAAGGGFVCGLSDANPVNRHRPSVDVLFNSAAELLGSRALGVLLTGMGKDGAQGMLAMKKAGAWTVAQDEKSSVVWGMPREAAMIGGASEVASLKDIPGLLTEKLRNMR